MPAKNFDLFLLNCWQTLYY